MAIRYQMLIACCLCLFCLCGDCLGQGQYENVARGKPCTMSSTWAGPPGNRQTPRSTGLAVDGVLSGYDAWCVHTGYDDTNAFWEVDLGRMYPIYEIVSYGRNGHAGRMADIEITVDGQHCYTYPSSITDYTDRVMTVRCDSLLNGTKVRLTKLPSASSKFINLCELQVRSCSDRYWGSGCDVACGQCSGWRDCNKVTGACDSCQPGWKTAKCTQECDDGTYGQDCGFQCGAQCADVCDKVTGQCTCNPGWQPPDCVNMCPSGSYGQDCGQQCGAGCYNTCDRISGVCVCTPGWYPPLCRQACFAGKYGQNCRENCSENCMDSGLCDAVDGHCTCKLGYQPPLCVTECPNGTYGQDCGRACSQNCVDGQCDKATGGCTCKPGWTGQRCDQMCGAGTYGQDCRETCGRCQDGAACNHISGHCSACASHFTMPFCSECQDGFYGQDCAQNCSTQCSDLCDKTTGHCTCNRGWQPPSCTQECPAGRYGDQCLSVCGNCSGQAACHHDTGRCDSGCQPGFALPLCQQAMQMMADSGGDGNTGVVVGAVVGVVAVVAVVAVIVLIVGRRRGWRLRGKKKEAGSNNNNHNMSAAPHTDHVYQNVTLSRQQDLGLQLVQPSKGELVSSDGEPEKAGRQKPKIPKPKRKPADAVKPKMKDSPKADQQTIGDAQVYVNVDTGRKPPGTPPSKPLPPPTVGLLDTETVDPEGLDDVMIRNDVYYDDDVYMTSEAARLQLECVQQHLLDRLRAEDLAAEFAELEKGLTRDCLAGSDDTNYYKNRFTSILPYDDTRVVLHNPPHKGANDYINASYIRGWNSEKEYIAAQGPRGNTVEDMWWMMWQEQVTHIVMLTNTVEKDKKKCDEYWPGLGAERNYGAICVTGLDVQQRADYVIRTFDVKEKSSGFSLKVNQHHYVTWPDHDVPSVTSLVDFWCSVSTAYRGHPQPAGPLLVHCSAGVGRTGAFIALDSLMQQSQHDTQPDVLRTTTSLRHDRCNMIQTQAQYRLVHEAALEAYTCRNCRIPVTSLGTVLTSTVDAKEDNEYIDKEFQKLQQMKVLLNKPSHTEAEMEENIDKNRDVSVLPDDKHLVFLTHYVKGRNQYINAVYSPTYYRRHGCILTQLPLQHTAIDFWRLVAGNDVKLVVSLGSELNESEMGDCYWACQKDQPVTYGPFSITLTYQNKIGQHLTSYSLSLLHKDSAKSSELRLLHFSAWSGELPDDVTDLLQLMYVVTEEDARDTPSLPPVVLQCRDGASRCGLIRAIADVISRMTSEGQVDVYTGVKHVQNVRPESVSSVAQYRYVYHVLQLYLENSSVYQNT